MVDAQIRNVTEANAGALMRSLIAGDVKNEYQKIEESQHFDNPDEAHLWNSFIFMLCTLLQNSSFSDDEKADLYFRLVNLSLRGVPETQVNEVEGRSTSGGVLYATGEDGFARWSLLAAGWNQLNGMLVSDGSDTDSIVPILAPYEPETPDYAVETAMRLVESYRGSFGLVVRANDNREGYAVGIGSWTGDRRKQIPNICYMNVDFHRRGCRAEAERFEPGADIRTYRVEVEPTLLSFLWKVCRWRAQATTSFFLPAVSDCGLMDTKWKFIASSFPSSAKTSSGA